MRCIIFMNCKTFCVNLCNVKISKSSKLYITVLGFGSFDFFCFDFFAMVFLPLAVCRSFLTLCIIFELSST